MQRSLLSFRSCRLVVGCICSSIVLSTAALADQNSYQHISSSTSASDGATAVSHIDQSAYQAGGWSEYGNQQIWQGVDADTYAHGTGATAVTQIDQSAAQIYEGDEFNPYSQELWQATTSENAAWGQWSMSNTDIDQFMQQVLSDVQAP